MRNAVAKALANHPYSKNTKAYRAIKRLWNATPRKLRHKINLSLAS